MSKIPYTITRINGIQTVLYPIKDIPAVLAEMMIKAGSWYESFEHWGAFHLIEHLCHQGTKGFPTALDLELFKEDHGLTGNAYTGGDRVGFWLKGPDYSVEALLEFLNQIVYQPLLEQKNFAKEISVIEQEYRGKWDNPFRRFDLGIDENLWGKGYPYLRDGMGQPDYIKTFDQQSLTKLHQEYFTAQNTLLAVIGNFDPDKFYKKATKALQPPAGEGKKYLLPKIKPGKNQKLHIEDVAQNRISMAWIIPGRDKLDIRDRIVINLGMYLFGGTAHSILFQELREKRGLVYSTSSHMGAYPKHGLIEIEAATQPQTTREVVKLSQELFEDFLTKPIDQHTFKRAKKFMNASTVINFDSLGQIAGSVINNFFYEGRVYLPAELIDLTLPITAAQVQETILKALHNQPPYISIMTKTKDLVLD